MNTKTAAVHLSAKETKRFWKHSEEEFRSTVRARAAVKSEALRAPVSIVGNDGLVLETVGKAD